MERVGNQASEREKLPLAGSSFRKEIFEVPPGADRVKAVTRYVLHTLRVSSENHWIFNRVGPRIISSLRR